MGRPEPDVNVLQFDEHLVFDIAGMCEVDRRCRTAVQGEHLNVGGLVRASHLMPVDASLGLDPEGQGAGDIDRQHVRFAVIAEVVAAVVVPVDRVVVELAPRQHLNLVVQPVVRLSEPPQEQGVAAVELDHDP